MSASRGLLAALPYVTVLIVHAVAEAAEAAIVKGTTGKGERSETGVREGNGSARSEIE